MVLDSVLSKVPVHKTELLHLLMKLERCNLCIETMCPGSREAAHFVPGHFVHMVCVLHLREAFSCGVYSFCGVLSVFDTSSYKNLKPFKIVVSLHNP